MTLNLFIEGIALIRAPKNIYCDSVAVHHSVFGWLYMFYAIAFLYFVYLYYSMTKLCVYIVGCIVETIHTRMP